MNASGLLIVLPVPEIRLQTIERLGFRRKKPEGVEMSAAERPRFDQEVDFLLWNTKGNRCAVSHGGAPVDHGPFVHSVAREVGRACLGVAEETKRKLEALPCLRSEQGGIGSKGPAVESVGSRRKQASGLSAVLEGDSKAGVPAFQFAEGQSIIGVQEVVNGMLLAARFALAGGLGPGTDPSAVIGGGLEPIRARDH